MDCERIKELLLSYIDNEIDDDERKLVEVHLSGCAECTAEMEALAVTGSRLRQAYETVAAGVSPSANMWQTIKNKVTAKQPTGERDVDRSKSRWGWLFGWRRPVWRMAAAGTVALSCLIALVVMNNTPAIVPMWTAAEQAAIDIAANDPAVQALLDGEGIVYAVVPVNGDEDTGYYQVGFAPVDEVNSRSDNNSEALDSELDSLSISYDFNGAVTRALCGELSSTWSNAIVDVGNNKVVYSQHSSEASISDCLSAEQVQNAAEIAQADPRIYTEAIVINVSLLNDYDAELGEFSDEMVVWVRLSDNDDLYFAKVDLDEQKVVKLIEGGG